MASYRRSSATDRTAHKHYKPHRHAHDKHATDDMAHGSFQTSRSRRSQQCTDEADSDSSDEILIKGKASRRFLREDKKDIARQLKNSDKAQQGTFRTSSSSSQEIHIHYVPIVTTSVSPPPTNSRQSHSRSSNSSKSGGLSASDITSSLKGITMSWLSRRSDDSHKTTRQSRSRSKHEKRDKHGKKRVSTSKFLAPLAQRWVCYKCGKLRSDKIQERHPLKEGQKMQPNWCGKCRIHGELHGRTLVFDGQRHYCWGCGIVRSRTYHDDNPIEKDEVSMPNYCKPCREISPAFDYNLREASEIGSVASVRNKAFYRQMEDAELSDVHEEEDDEPTCAPGKENQNPKSTKELKASKSFMLENCSYKVKTTSDASSEGGVPISILKALHLEEERARITSGGGCRLSDGSYQPPTAESALNERFKPGLKTAKVTREALSAIDDHDDYKMRSHATSVPEEEEPPSSPTTILAPAQQDSGDNCDGPVKKKVHWINQGLESTTAESDASDSANCSGYPSEPSHKSTGSRRSRRDPGDIITGSPPMQEDESTMGDLRHDIQPQEKAALRRLESHGTRSGRDLPTGTCGGPAYDIDDDTASYRHDSTQSSHSQSIPPSPPKAFVPLTTGRVYHTGQDEYESPITPWADSPEIPNLSRPCLSPPKQRAAVSHDPDPVFKGFGTRSGYMQEYSPYQSAAHFSDSAQSRDYSGFDAPGEDHVFFQHDRYGPTVQHGGWPPASCPVYDDYSASSDDGHGDGDFFGPYSDSNSFPSTTGYSAFDFDFNGLGGSRPSEGTGNLDFTPEGEKFVRKKKTTQDAPRHHSWRLYDDGDDDASSPDAEGCKWRKDGRTTIHRSSNDYSLQERKTVQILSIREMVSDEDLTTSEDIDEISELDIVVVDDDLMLKSICAA